MQNPKSYSTSDDTQPEATRAYGRREWSAGSGQEQGQTRPYQPQHTRAYSQTQRKAAADRTSDYLSEELDHEAFPETHPFRPTTSEEVSWQPTRTQAQTPHRQQQAQQAQSSATRLSQVDDSKVAGRVAYDSDGNLVVVKKEEKSAPVQMAAIVGSALSAVTSAFFSSHIGIGGSVLTVFIGAAVSAAATQIYTHLIQKSTDKLKHVTQGSGHQQLDGVMDSSQLDGGYGYSAETATSTGYATYDPQAAAEEEAQARKVRKRGIIIVAIAALIAVVAAAGVVTLATNGEGIGTKTPSIIATQTTDDTSTDEDATTSGTSTSSESDKKSDESDRSSAAATTSTDTGESGTSATSGTTSDEGTGTTSGTSGSSSSSSSTSGTGSNASSGTSSGTGTGTSSGTGSSSGTSTDSGSGTSGSSSTGTTSGGSTSTDSGSTSTGSGSSATDSTTTTTE